MRDSGWQRGLPCSLWCLGFGLPELDCDMLGQVCPTPQ